MLLLDIDRTSSVPAYSQVCNQIVALADQGTLQPGDHLPATRSLAASTGLHRSSVVRAYGELRALGYIESRAGGYTTIRRRHRPPATHRKYAGPTADGLIDWSELTPAPVSALQDRAHVVGQQPESKTGVIDLDRLCADPSLAPDDELRRCIKSILVRTGGAALDYSDTRGWESLREVIARRMCNHGVVISKDELLVTNGAQQAFDLLFRYLVKPGDQVLVEAPTYGMAHALMHLHDIQPIEVPMLDDGMDLDVLQRLLQDGQQRPKLIFTMPNFHNPTGITTSQPHRERLLALCEAHRTPLLEDGFEEEMKYFGRAVMPVKSMDSKGIVLYVGTFSKVVFPGLRIGWIAAPREVIGHLANIMQASCISGNTLAQATAARYCASGEFEIYLRRIHRVYRRRMQALLRGLEQHMPPGVKWTRPSGGYTAWITLEENLVTEHELISSLSRKGVLVGAGSRYFAQPPDKVHLRLSVACVTEQQIENGCRMLGEVLSTYHG